MYIIPKILKVKALEEYKLLLEFENGEEKIFDMEKYINQKFYQKLKNRKYFENVRSLGNTIEWENGEDVAPENLYYDSILVKE